MARSRDARRRTTIIAAALLLLLVGLLVVFWRLARIAADNDQITRLHREADRLLDGENYTAAVTPLRELARLQPDKPGALPELGRSVARSSKRNELLKQADATLAHNPSDPVALTIAVSALLGRDDEQRRLRYLRRLVEVRPAETVFRVTLAQELVNTFLFAEARPHLEHLIRSAPDDPAAYFLRGRVALYETPTPEGLAQAEADFKKGLEIAPDVPNGRLNLGRVYLKRGKPQEAIEQLKQAAERMPSNPDVHYELANAFRAIGDTAMAAKAQAAFANLREQTLRTEGLVKKCHALPNDFDLHLETARQLLNQEDPEKAISYVDRALTLRPGDPRAKELAKELDAQLRAGGGR